MTLAYDLYRELKVGRVKSSHLFGDMQKRIISHLENSEKFILPTVDVKLREQFDEWFDDDGNPTMYEFNYPEPWASGWEMGQNLRLPFEAITVEHKINRTESSFEGNVLVARNIEGDGLNSFEFVNFFKDHINNAWRLQLFKGTYDDEFLEEKKGFDFVKLGSEYKKSDYKELEGFISVTVRALDTIASHREGLELNTPYYHKAGVRSAMSKKRRMFAHRQLFFSPIPVKREKHEPVGTHASPAMHKRRGHFRQLKSGKVVWVKSSIVGKPENGVITKDYVMEGANQ